jgi:LPXTG cell wall anchor motif
MGIRVGAPRRRVARTVTATLVVFFGLVITSARAGAQAAPTGGIDILKVEIGGVVPATFEVTGPGITGIATLTANVVAEDTPTPALPALPPLTPGTYVITETAPADENGQSVWELTGIDCGGAPLTRNGNSITITVADEIITCTFTDEVTRAAIQGIKTVVGDTSSWIRPAQFHITCPDIQLDIDIEPPVGPGGPGTYIIGQGSIPPATCTISEIDTGSDASVSVTMVVTNHGVPIASGGSSVTFTSNVGDDLVLQVTNGFPTRRAGPEQPGQDPGATTTVAGGSTTTTTGGATTTTLPGGGATTTSGGATTTSGGGAATSSPATTAPQLPVTGTPTAGLIVFALVALIGGITLVARTRRLVD